MHLWRKFPRPAVAAAIAALLVICYSALLLPQAHAYRQTTELSTRDGAILIDPKGDTVYGHQPDKALIPASTLKILTSLVALHHLGAEYRFSTEFYRGAGSMLKVKGYGDPLLISEVLPDIAGSLKIPLQENGNCLSGILLDDTYFGRPLTIPGITSSAKPHDAPNGALNVNFNTVFFSRSDNGSYISAEPQTPLIGYARKKIKNTGLKSGRIVLTNNAKEATLYAGRLLAYFMRAQNICIEGKVASGKVDTHKDRLILRYESPYTVTDIIARLLRHSNNFIANQLLIASGAKTFGAPGTLAKGIQSASDYAATHLGIRNVIIAEGSGISRKSRISARNMALLLKAFERYYDLMPSKDGIYYKTGTLKGIRTRAGYIDSKNGRLYRFAVFLNTPGKSPEGIVRKFREIVDKKEGTKAQRKRNYNHQRSSSCPRDRTFER